MAYCRHRRVQIGAHFRPDPTPEKATALALTAGQCDINSGDTYNNFLLKAVAQAKNTSSGVAPVRAAGSRSALITFFSFFPPCGCSELHLHVPVHSERVLFP